MEIIDDVLHSLEGLGIAAELKAIRDYLDKCQPDFTRFMAEYGIHCPSGCDPAVSISFRISQDRRLFLSQHTSFVPRKKMH